MNFVTAMKIWKKIFGRKSTEKCIFYRMRKFSNRFLGYLTGYFIIFSAVLFLSAILLISCIPKLSLFLFGLPRFPFFGVSIFSISILAFQLVHFEGEQPHTKIFCIILTQRQYITTIWAYLHI